MNEAIFDEVMVLWAEHRSTPWPDDLYWADHHDGDVVEIDGAMAGCISGYLESRTGLDAERSRALQDGVRALERILPRLRGEGAAYVRRLIRIAELIDRDDRPADQV